MVRRGAQIGSCPSSKDYTSTLEPRRRGRTATPMNGFGSTRFACGASPPTLVESGRKALMYSKEGAHQRSRQEDARVNEDRREHRIIRPTGGVAERTNALVLKTRGGETPEGSNPSAPALPYNILHVGLQIYENKKCLLKKIKQIEKFAFKLCKLRATSLSGKRCRPCKDSVGRRREIL